MENSTTDVRTAAFGKFNISGKHFQTVKFKGKQFYFESSPKTRHSWPIKRVDSLISGISKFRFDR